MNNSEDILAQLATLEPKALREAQLRVAALLGRSPGDPAAIDHTEEDLVYQEMKSIIHRKTGQECPPLSALRKTKYNAAFRKGAAVVIAYARENLKPKGRGGMIQAVRLLVGLVVRQIQDEQRVRLAIGPACQQLARVGEIVEQQFPGYLNSNLLSIVLRPKKISP